MALCALVVSFALPLAAQAFDEDKRPLLEETAEFRSSTDVLEGQVKSLQRLDRAGKPASAGPRFRLDLTVSAVFKAKEKGRPRKGDTVSVLGWLEGKRKQVRLPKVKDEVIAFLQRQKDGSFEALPPSGFRVKVGGTPPDSTSKSGGDKEGPPKPGPSLEKRRPPSKERAAAARYQGVFEKLPGVLLTRKAGASGADEWEKAKRSGTVYSNDTLLSLPGFANVVQTSSGVTLLLRGNVREHAMTLLQRDYLAGSAVVLHKSKDLDLTLLRGRIFLTNHKKDGAVRVRLRFDEREVWDVTLNEPDTQIGVDFFKFYTPTSNHLAGEEPQAFLFLVLIRGKVTVNVDDVEPSQTRRAKGGRAYLFGWNSLKRASEPVELERLPPSWSKSPPTAAEVGAERVRELRGMNAALKDLEARLSARKPNVAIKEGLTKEDPLARMLSVHCLGEVDDLGNLIDALGDKELTHVPDRQAAVYTLKRWLARGAAQWKLLYDDRTGKGALRDRKYKPGEASCIRDLLFDLPVEDWRKPETFEVLARCLRSPRVAIAELGYMHLLHLSHGVRLPPFNAANSLEKRKAFAEKIADMVANKQLPPPLPERKKEAPPGPKPGAGR
jgi:hypothetical protein